MVIITAVYVVATIAICVANFKSAKASREQLEESKRQFEEQKLQFEEQKRQFEESKEQYEETLRLQCMPFLQLEYKYESLIHEDFCLNLPLYACEPVEITACYFVLKNLGNGTAINMIYSWKYIKSKETGDAMPINAIRPGTEYTIKIVFDTDDSLNELKPVLEFEYNDLRGESYLQKVFLKIDETSGYVICDNDEPKLL